MEHVLLGWGGAGQHGDRGCITEAEVLRVSVAKSCKRLRQLCTGWPAVVRLLAALAAAAGETRAAATGVRAWA